MLSDVINFAAALEIDCVYVYLGVKICDLSKLFVASLVSEFFFFSFSGG